MEAGQQDSAVRPAHWGRLTEAGSLRQVRPDGENGPVGGGERFDRPGAGKSGDPGGRPGRNSAESRPFTRQRQPWKPPTRCLSAERASASPEKQRGRRESGVAREAPGPPDRRKRIRGCRKRPTSRRRTADAAGRKVDLTFAHTPRRASIHAGFRAIEGLRDAVPANFFADPLDDPLWSGHNLFLRC